MKDRFQCGKKGVIIQPESIGMLEIFYGLL